MTDEQQKRFLIDLLTVQIRELAAYRAFVESAKNNAGAYVEFVDDVLNEARHDPVVQTQLGSDFQVFVADALLGEEIEAGLALQAFWSQWAVQQKPN